MSKSYCSKLWNHQYIHMTGSFRFCCATNDNILDDKGNRFHINNTSLDNVWNSNRVKQTRLKMMNSEIVPECVKCVEQESRGYASMRTTDNKEYFFSQTTSDGSVSLKPTTMELHYGNVCNLKCRMCSQNYSNQIGKELLEIGQEDKNFIEWVVKESGNVNNWTNSLSVEYSWFQNTKTKNKLNEFISKNIETLTVIGGEPTIIPEFYDVFEYCEKQDTLKNKHFTIVTNLTNTNPKMVQWLPKLKSWTIWASIDGLNERTEYIRYPSNFNKVEENLKFYQSLIHEDKGFIMLSPAIQLLNIDQLDELLEWYIDLSGDRFGKNMNISWLAQVWYPRICNYDIAPKDYRYQIADKLEKKKEYFSQWKNISTFYSSQIKNLRSNTIDINTATHLQKAFIKYNDRLDKHRNRLTWRKLLPELEKSLTKSIK